MFFVNTSPETKLFQSRFLHLKPVFFRTAFTMFMTHCYKIFSLVTHIHVYIFPIHLTYMYVYFPKQLHLLRVHLWVHLWVHQWVHQWVHLRVHLWVHLRVHLKVHQWVHHRDPLWALLRDHLNLLWWAEATEVLNHHTEGPLSWILTTMASSQLPGWTPAWDMEVTIFFSILVNPVVWLYARCWDIKSVCVCVGGEHLKLYC